MSLDCNSAKCNNDRKMKPATNQSAVYRASMSYLAKCVKQRVCRHAAQQISALPLADLTAEEVALIKGRWNGFGSEYTLLFHRLYKTMCGFDDRWVAEDAYSPLILRALNPRRYALELSHKALLPSRYPQIPQPRCVAVCHEGVYYNHTFQPIDRQSVAALLMNEEAFIIKPTSDAMQGRGVRHIHDHTKRDVERLLEEYKNGFVAQEVVCQSDLTGRFNTHSVNTFRITTLSINGRASLCGILFRCGQGNTCVDNGAAGGLMVGVDGEGQFLPTAYDKYFNRHTESGNGVKFEGVVIPQMQHIVDQALSWHSNLMPECGIVGWDIALASDGKARLIEINLRWPGIVFEQICPGQPLFGERTSEVLEYAMQHSPSLEELVAERFNINVGRKPTINRE